MECMGKTFTTAEAAKKVGISRQSLLAWMNAGVIAAPKPWSRSSTGAEFRFWTQQDIDRLKDFKGTLKPGPKKARDTMSEEKRERGTGRLFLCGKLNLVGPILPPW